MRDLSREPYFVEDALAPFRTRRVDQLQCDRRLEDEVVGAPDHAHAAPADLRDHPIASRKHFSCSKEDVGRILFRLGFSLIVVKGKQRFDFAP